MEDMIRQCIWWAKSSADTSLQLCKHMLLQLIKATWRVCTATKTRRQRLHSNRQAWAAAFDRRCAAIRRTQINRTNSCHSDSSQCVAHRDRERIAIWNHNEIRRRNISQVDDIVTREPVQTADLTLIPCQIGSSRLVPVRHRSAKHLNQRTCGTKSELWRIMYTKIVRNECRTYEQSTSKAKKWTKKSNRNYSNTTLRFTNAYRMLLTNIANSSHSAFLILQVSQTPLLIDSSVVAFSMKVK